MRNKYKILYIFPALVIVFLAAQPAKAVCPVCTIAVGAGVGLSRSLGVNDVISGLWIGALIVSMIVWTLNWFNRKGIDFKGREVVTIAGYYILTVVPMYFSGLIKGPLQTVCACGLDMLMLGIIVGSFAFWFASEWYLHLKKNNNDKAYFPYQKVAMPLVLLLVLSFVFYFMLK